MSEYFKRGHPKRPCESDNCDGGGRERHQRDSNCDQKWGDCYSNCYEDLYCPVVPCVPQYGCGSKYIEWRDRNGCKYRSLMVSETNIATLNSTLATIAGQLSNFYNSGIVNAGQIASLGVFGLQSTLVDLIDSPPATYTGTIPISTELASHLSSLRTSYPLSTIVVGATAQLLTNNMVSITIQINIANGPTPGAGLTMVLTAQSNNCGASPPTVISGTLTGQGLTPVPT